MEGTERAEPPEPTTPATFADSRSTPVLEVIATSLEDALASQRGGAHRLEVVSAMCHDGLTPDLDLARRIRDTIPLPLRIMLRLHAGFVITLEALDALTDTAHEFRAAGIDQFVFGFLTPDNTLDLGSLHTLASAIQPARWTLHRAFDHTPDAAYAFAECATLPNLDHVLTSGSPHGLDAGLHTLRDRAPWQTPALRWIAGGGLRPEHLPPLLEAGITEFHTGRAVRVRQRWDLPVDETLVRHLATFPAPHTPPHPPATAA